MRIPALVLALILPLIMVFSAALVIQAGIRMDSAEDLKTKDYFQTSAFADSFYSKASTIPVSYTHLTLPTILLV